MKKILAFIILYATSMSFYTIAGSEISKWLQKGKKGLSSIAKQLTESKKEFLDIWEEQYKDNYDPLFDLVNTILEENKENLVNEQVARQLFENKKTKILLPAYLPPLKIRFMENFVQYCKDKFFNEASLIADEWSKPAILPTAPEAPLREEGEKPAYQVEPYYPTAPLYRPEPTYLQYSETPEEVTFEQEELEAPAYLLEQEIPEWSKNLFRYSLAYSLSSTYLGYLKKSYITKKDIAVVGGVAATSLLLAPQGLKRGLGILAGFTASANYLLDRLKKYKNDAEQQ